MLIISRKHSEGIKIAGPCRIVVLDVRGGNVKLGIEADRSVRILRSELADEPDEPRKDAA